VKKWIAVFLTALCLLGAMAHASALREVWHETPSLPIRQEEDSFDLPFSAQRAHSRNRVIHALGEKTFVAQCASGTGGSWSGTVRNIKENWSPVFCFRDGSEAMYQLEQLGAVLLDNEDLSKLSALQSQPSGFF